MGYSVIERPILEFLIFVYPEEKPARVLPMAEYDWRGTLMPTDAPILFDDSNHYEPSAPPLMA